MPARIGIILLQLGTPDAPTPSALRRYLGEFLADRRVVDLPRTLWWPILHLMVLRTRPRRAARLYEKVWIAEGSPLAVTSAAQAAALAERLAVESGVPTRVLVGMRYGEPSIRTAVTELARSGVERILAFPMYPQYAGATTGSSLERLFQEIDGLRVVPSVRVVPPYYDDQAYIDALVTVAREALASMGEPPTRLILSFHGLPKRYVEEGDPYFEHCHKTAERLEHAFGLCGIPATVAFQSRFGREEWLQPYTDRLLGTLGREGARVAVMCPGFTADCLETLEEIGIRGAEQFHQAGGSVYHRVPCLNTHPAWVRAMTTIARRELGGWI